MMRSERPPRVRFGPHILKNKVIQMSKEHGFKIEFSNRMRQIGDLISLKAINQAIE